MGKRSDFLRRERDFYETPETAVAPLLAHLPPDATFYEPCAGAGALSRHLVLGGLICAGASDIEPQADGIETIDALHLLQHWRADYIITNPPWPQRGGEPTLSIAKHLASLAPTWLLLSADFAHNRYFAELAPICVKIVSVGRVSWMQNGTAGKDNCAWYLFDAKHNGLIEFVPRDTKLLARATTGNTAIRARDAWPDCPSCWRRCPFPRRSTWPGCLGGPALFA